MTRRATLQDAPAIARVHVEAWEAAYRGLIPDEVIDARTVELRTGQWTTALADPSCFALVACDADDGVEGFASVRLFDEPDAGFESYLQTLYVRPGVWRRGIGRELLGAVCARLAAIGVRNIVLRTLRLGNARGFYERLGARVVPGGLAFDAGKFDDVVYAIDDVQTFFISERHSA
jgi:GNAT superfamily N-acetyltransferase